MEIQAESYPAAHSRDFSVQRVRPNALDDSAFSSKIQMTDDPRYDF